MSLQMVIIVCMFPHLHQYGYSWYSLFLSISASISTWLLLEPTFLAHFSHFINMSAACNHSLCLFLPLYQHGYCWRAFRLSISPTLSMQLAITAFVRFLPYRYGFIWWSHRSSVLSSLSIWPKQLITLFVFQSVFPYISWNPWSLSCSLYKLVTVFLSVTPPFSLISTPRFLVLQV
jgi:hypothetical protein